MDIDGNFPVFQDPAYTPWLVLFISLHSNPKADANPKIVPGWYLLLLFDVPKIRVKHRVAMNQFYEYYPF